MKIIKGVIAVMGLMLMINSVSFAQDNPRETEEFKNHQDVYLRAIRYNDVSVARTALYSLIDLAPNDISLLDSLAYLYFEYRQYASAALVCKEALSLNPKHPPALEMSAISFENLGLNEQALTAYESLYLIQNNTVTLYKITYLQYQLKRYAEFQNNAETLIADESTLELKLFFTGENNEQQEIPMRAAVYNFQGLIAKEAGNKEEAVKFFDEALSIAPEFYLAKISKESLNN